MFCKHCGGNISASDTKCKRCGKAVPARSDCGGFYDLVPGKPVVAAMPTTGAEPTYAKDSDEKSKLPLELIIIAAAALAIILILFVVMFIKIGKQADEITNLADEIAALESRNVPGETGTAGVATDPVETDTPAIPEDTQQIPVSTDATEGETTEPTEETEPEEETEDPNVEEDASFLDWAEGILRGENKGTPYNAKATDGETTVDLIFTEECTLQPQISDCKTVSCVWGKEFPVTEGENRNELSFKDLPSGIGEGLDDGFAELFITVKYRDEENNEQTSTFSLGNIPVEDIDDLLKSIGERLNNNASKDSKT